MTRKEWARSVGNTWKGSQLRAMVRPPSYAFWQFHAGMIASNGRGLRFTFAALRYGRDARRIAAVVRD